MATKPGDKPFAQSYLSVMAKLLTTTITTTTSAVRGRLVLG